MPIKGLNSKGNILGRGSNLPLAVRYEPVLYLSSTYGRFDTSQSGGDTFINKWTDPYSKLSAEQTTGSYRPKLVKNNGRLRPEFDGTDDYLNVENNISDSQNFSICIWAYKDDWSSATRNRDILSISDTLTTDPDGDKITFRLGGTDNNFIGYSRGGDGGYYLLKDVSSKTGWIHIILTQKRTSASNIDIKSYVNNVLEEEKSKNWDGGLRPSLGTYTGGFWFNGSLENPWKEQLDEMIIYNKTLTSSQITNLYNEGKKLLNL